MVVVEEVVEEVEVGVGVQEVEVVEVEVSINWIILSFNFDQLQLIH